MKRCPLGKSNAMMHCNKSIDVVLLIDGSGSLGSKGWAAEIIAAKSLVDAFEGAPVKMSVILYSGPRTWGGVYRCIGKNAKTVDLESVCKIKMVTHLTGNMTNVKKLIGELTWPQGSTLTSLALMQAKSELSLGRGDVKLNVIVI